jgi:hypothetical protein
VHCLLHREVVNQQIPAREVAPEEERVRVHHDDEKTEKNAGQNALRK